MSNDYADILKELVEEFSVVEKHKHHIEGKTATTIVNVKFMENLRHSYSHLLTGIKFQYSDRPRVEVMDQYKTALNHLRNLDVNGYEYLAGVLLKRLRTRIENSGYFVDVGKAMNCFEEASSKYEMGRSSRTENKETALECFEASIDLCLEGAREVVPATKAEKTRINLALASLIVAIIAILIAIFK